MTNKLTKVENIMKNDTQPIFNNDEVCNIPTNQCRTQRQNYNPLQDYSPTREEKGIAKPVGRPTKAQHNNEFLKLTDFLPELNPAS